MSERPPHSDEFENVEPQEEVSEESKESQIVHRVNSTDAKGQPVVIEHGPMPISEWAAYEKENNL